jgi:cell division topological specificity factor
MASLINNLLGKKSSSAGHAKERLHLVLIHDRTALSHKDLESLKDRLIEVISEYVMINPAETEIQIQNNGREQTLIAHIPLRKPRTRK